MTLQTALGYVPSNPNLIINGGFTVNQRVYATGTALAAGVYAHDRWKAGAAGGAYSFTQLDSPTTITITAGTFIQVIENKNVQGGSYVLSWTGTATGRYGLNSATPSGSYVASPILITGQTAGTTMSVEFGTGTLTGVKLEAGTVATPFVHKPYAEELRNCQRYTTRVEGVSAIGQGCRHIGNYCITRLELPVQMRTSPTLTTSSPSWASVAPVGNQIAFNNYVTSDFATITGTLSFQLGGVIASNNRVQLNLSAGSISGTAGDAGAISLGNTAYLLLSAEL